MPSVCQLVHSLNVGGAEILADRFARRMRGHGRVVFACLDDLGPLGEQLLSENVTVERLDRRSGMDWRCAWKLRQFLKREEVRLVHAHQYTPFFYAAFSRFLGGGPPILFTEHGRFFPDGPNRKRMWINPWLLRKSDRVIAVGECVREALFHFEGIPRGKVDVIYNGVDLDRFAPTGSRAATRCELGVAEDEFVLLTVARLDSIKDHATSVRAMAELRRRVPKLKLLLAGDGPERGNLESLIRQTGTEGTVRMLGLRRDVPRLMEAADGFLLTSVSEGIPLTLIEAMGASLPIVATRVGGIPEVVEEGVTGLLVPAGNAAAVAEALVSLERDRGFARSLGQKGHQVAHRRFREDDMIRHYEDVYRRMLQGTDLGS